MSWDSENGPGSWDRGGGSGGRMWNSERDLESLGQGLIQGVCVFMPDSVYQGTWTIRREF